jgi:hypothetical protein
MLYRQGDILLQKINSIPEDAKELPREDGKVVLAHGEVTGHKHAIAARKAKLLSENRQQELCYLVLLTYAWLRHEEHDAIRLPPGNYLIKRQREYTPEALRYVQD